MTFYFLQICSLLQYFSPNIKPFCIVLFFLVNFHTVGTIKTQCQLYKGFSEFCFGGKSGHILRKEKLHVAVFRQ